MSEDLCRSLKDLFDYTNQTAKVHSDFPDL